MTLENSLNDKMVKPIYASFLSIHRWYDIFWFLTLQNDLKGIYGTLLKVSALVIIVS